MDAMKLPLALVLALIGAVMLTGCQKKNSTADLQPEPLEPYRDAALDQPVDMGYTAAPQPIPVQTQPTISGRTYTVQRGDTLWSIASRQYGNGQRWRDIAAANGITNERQLAVGQVLVLP